MIAGLWPTPIADVAAAIVGVLVAWLVRTVIALSERVSRLEATLDEKNRQE